MPHFQWLKLNSIVALASIRKSIEIYIINPL